uniref:Pol protein n=1 Tax=Chelonoidis abingdonii TaxID=106734 RepID=A0A8C0INL0_CHEAB
LVVFFVYPEVRLYTDSWTVAQRLAIWMGHWRAQDWAIHGTPVRGALVWQELCSDAQDLLIYVFHKVAHQNRTQEHHWNAAADQLGEALSLLGVYHWAQARGIPTSHVALKTAKAICKICQIVKPFQVEAGSPGQGLRADQPAQIWQVDYVGPLPHNHCKAYILTMVDMATIYKRTFGGMTGTLH